VEFFKEKPKFVELAQTIIYGTLGISAISTVFEFVYGPVEFPELLANLLLVGVVATLPYSMGRGSNKARYIYAAFTVISALIMFASSEFIKNTPRFDVHIGVLLTPIELFVCGMLFTKESSEWFKKTKTKLAKTNK